MMKKVLTTIITMILIMTLLTACGSNKSSGGTGNSNTITVMASGVKNGTQGIF